MLSSFRDQSKVIRFSVTRGCARGAGAALTVEPPPIRRPKLKRKQKWQTSRRRNFAASLRNDKSLSSTHFVPLRNCKSFSNLSKSCVSKSESLPESKRFSPLLKRLFNLLYIKLVGRSNCSTRFILYHARYINE